jgi:outer membrane protein OmpA-like peptidoglycan-associated protein
MKRLYFLLVMLAGISTIYAQDATADKDDLLYIVFPANSADLKAVGTELAIQNTQVFNKVAKLLLENPQYRILVDGHANPVIGTTAEENKSLKPLSVQRAEQAADFLVNYYKIDRRRLILTGAGGIYPFGDKDPSHNRRVSFFIIQPK